MREGRGDGPVNRNFAARKASPGLRGKSADPADSYFLFFTVFHVPVDHL